VQWSRDCGHSEGAAQYGLGPYPQGSQEIANRARARRASEIDGEEAREMSADSKLDALLGLLKPTVIRRFDKQRTKARVLERAHARKAIPGPLGLAALLVAASAAAAGVASVVDNRELGDDDARPPRVVQGVPAPKRQGTTPLGHKLSPRRDSPAESPQASQPGGSPVLPGPAAEPSP